MTNEHGMIRHSQAKAEALIYTLHQRPIIFGTWLLNDKQRQLWTDGFRCVNRPMDSAC